MIRETERWRGISALAFVPVAVGILLRSPGILFLGIVGIGYGAFATQTTPPTPDLTIKRELSETDPDPGSDVTVTLSITNEGNLVPDLRLVDGVPPALEVVDGSPRLATALRGGRTAEVTYTLRARRGQHEFEPVFVAARNASSSAEYQDQIQVASSMTCVPELASMQTVPLRGKTGQRVGRLTTGSGGAGVEFFAVREYRPGDSLSRIDWRRLAKTGEFTTIEFHEERAASVVLVLDGRVEAYVADDEGRPAMDYQVDAAGAIAQALLDVGDQVGLASFGPNWTWLGPRLGREHRARLRRELAVAQAYSPVPSDDRFLPGLAIRRLRKHLPGAAQVVFLSPLPDDSVMGYIRQLEALGYPVTVVTPDLTTTETPGQTLARLERDLRIRDLREQGVRVIDWDVTEPIGVAVAEAARGWRS